MVKKSFVLILTFTFSLVLVIIYFYKISQVSSKASTPTQVPKLKYYHGIIVGKNKQPISGAKVSILEYSNITAVTNYQGYFALKGKNINIAYPNRIIIRKNLLLDTVNTHYISASNYKINERFLFSNKRPDTIILKQ